MLSQFSFFYSSWNVFVLHLRLILHCPAHVWLALTSSVYRPLMHSHFSPSCSGWIRKLILMGGKKNIRPQKSRLSIFCVTKMFLMNTQKPQNKYCVCNQSLIHHIVPPCPTGNMFHTNPTCNKSQKIVRILLTHRRFGFVIEFVDYRTE